MSADRAIVKSFALLSTVLTDGEGTRYLVIDALGGKVTLVRVPDGLQPGDYGSRYFHSPVPWDPARATLERE